MDLYLFVWVVIWLPSQIYDPEHQAEEASKIKVGDRCEVLPGGRRGEVKYVGKIPQLKLGFWVGVALDEPVGINDGRCGVKHTFTDCV